MDSTLGLRPSEMVLLVAELRLGVHSAKLPVDSNSRAVHLPIPGVRFSLKQGQIRDPAFSQALAGEETDLNLRLVEPTAVLRRVVDPQAAP